MQKNQPPIPTGNRAWMLVALTVTFMFNFSRGAIGMQEGEGSRGGTMSVLQDAESYSIAATIGPVMQAGEVIGNDGQTDVVAAVVSKTSKSFQALYRFTMLSGDCD